MDLVPLHAPDAVHEVALVEDHVKVVEEPDTMLDGDAIKEMPAIGTWADTVIVVETMADFPHTRL